MPNGFIRKGRTEMAKKSNDNNIAFEAGSGKVFADLGFVNAEQELLKAHLTLQIYKVVKARKLTQSRAAELLGIRQPHVSLLMRNRSGSFSVERLMDFLTDLGHDVEIADPQVTQDQVEADYGRGLTSPDAGRYDLVIGAVRHDSYQAMPGDALAALLAPGGTLADIKGMWRGHKLATSRDYWTL